MIEDHDDRDRPVPKDEDHDHAAGRPRRPAEAGDSAPWTALRGLHAFGNEATTHIRCKRHRPSTRRSRKRMVQRWLVAQVVPTRVARRAEVGRRGVRNRCPLRGDPRPLRSDIR